MRTAVFVGRFGDALWEERRISKEGAQAVRVFEHRALGLGQSVLAVCQQWLPVRAAGR